MTRNQIEAQKLSESIRSNKANEELTRNRDANTAKYYQDQITLGNRNAAENERANREREQFNVLSLNETKRHNQQQEYQNYLSLTESMRHNTATESINLQSLTEQKRANLAREQETNRANVAAEKNRSEQLAETIRANQASESIRNSANIETQRSNMANEAIRSQSNAISLLGVQEQQRAHIASEELTREWNATQAELKKQELEDRYFWQDKVNTILDAVLPDLANTNLGGMKDEIITDISQWINDQGNKAETIWKTKVERPFKEWLERAKSTIGSGVQWTNFKNRYLTR